MTKLKLKLMQKNTYKDFSHKFQQQWKGNNPTQIQRRYEKRLAAVSCSHCRVKASSIAVRLLPANECLPALLHSCRGHFCSEGHYFVQGGLLMYGINRTMIQRAYKLPQYMFWVEYRTIYRAWTYWNYSWFTIFISSKTTTRTSMGTWI